MSDTQNAPDTAIFNTLKDSLPEPEPVPTDDELESEGEELEEDLSDEPELDDEEESDDNDEEQFDIDGETVTLEELKNGYLRQSDYTKKTTAAKRLSEAGQQQEKLYSSLASTLDVQVKALEELMLKMDDSVDMTELRETDPSEYLRVKEEKTDRQKILEKVKADKEAAQKLVLADEQKKLFAALPHWEDATKRDADIKMFSDYAEKLGMTQEDVASLSNHKVILGLLAGAKYDKLQAKKPDALKKVKKNKPSSKGNAVSKVKSDAELFYGT